MSDDDEILPEEEGDPPPPDLSETDVASPKRVRKKKITQDVHDREDDRWWREALSTETGRRCIWSLFIDSGAFADRFGVSPNGSPSDLESWFHLGARSFGLKLYRKLMVKDHLAVVAMHRENDPAFFGTKERK